MQSRFAAMALLLVAAVAAPTAQAQAVNDVTLEVAPLAAPVPYDGSANLPFNVTVGCGLILTGGGSASVTVSSSDAPGFLTVAPATVEVAPSADCLTGSGTVTVGGTVTVTPTADAPGLADIAFNLTAQSGDASSDPVEASVQVAYRPGHRITPEVTFPLEVHGGNVTFNVTVEFTGNARSMVMFESVETEGGTLVGLEPAIREPPATVVLEVTFTAPDTEWTTLNATFYNYSHFLLLSGPAGGPELEAHPVWTFVNGDEGEDGGGGGKDSPSLPLGALLLALGGLAVARRRRAA